MKSFPGRILCLLLFLPAMALAGDTMSRVVFRDKTPREPANSQASLSKIFYRLGPAKTRLEEFTVPDLQQSLTIRNGKELWIINLTAKTGRHIPNPGPALESHYNIVPPDADHKPRYEGFQIGEELVFMQSKGVKPTPSTFEGKPAEVYEYKDGAYTLRFFVDGGKGLGAEALEGEKILARLKYESYTAGLPPLEDLFQPPPRITISEP